eukprot:scaffold1850_cov194-Pinguiococcus_pyrenoidosus.AAC.50
MVFRVAPRIRRDFENQVPTFHVVLRSDRSVWPSTCDLRHPRHVHETGVAALVLRGALQAGLKVESIVHRFSASWCRGLLA